jgi:biopolymer transport protein ExbD
MQLDQLRAYLEPRLQRNPTKSVIMQTSLDAQYQAMTDVFDELRQVGVRNLVIPTSTELELYGLTNLK